MNICVFEKDQYEPIKKAGRLAGQVLDLVCKNVKPGISTWELDVLAEDWIRSQGAVPTFKGYHGFTGTLCTSINHEVVHGVPNKNRILKEGDIISLDVGVTLKEKFNGKEWGYIGDTARTVAVSEISPQAQLLLENTEASLYEGIKFCKPGMTIKDISLAVENVGKKNNYGIVRSYGGHGVGPEYHCDPFVPNWADYFKSVPNTEIKPGMLICIEPMFNLGADDVRKLKDGWTVITSDHKLSAHFEHSILITEESSIITTKI